MNWKARRLMGGFTFAGVIWLLSALAQAAGEQEPWRAILPKDIYQELANREAQIINEQLNGKADEPAIMRAKVGAVFLAALTKSAKDVDPAGLAATRDAAFQLAQSLANKGDLAAAKKLAASLPNKATPGGGKVAANWGDHISLVELMDHLRPKDKGGDGMHPDLQSNIRLKSALNSIEEKIRALAMKEIAPANIKKEAKELELLGYRTAVLGSLTYYFAPAAKSGKKDPEEWRALSLKTRDQSVGLATAAIKGDTSALFKVGGDLNSTCTQCHTVFR